MLSFQALDSQKSRVEMLHAQASSGVRNHHRPGVFRKASASTAAAAVACATTAHRDGTDRAGELSGVGRIWV